MANFIYHFRSFWAKNSSATMRLIIINAAFSLSVWIVSAIGSDFVWLLFLGIVCTSFAFLVIVDLVKHLGVFTVSLSSDKLGTFVQVPDSFRELAQSPYTLITYMFSHAGLWHLLMNMLILYFVGRVLEDLLGSKRVYQIYFAAGIIGALAFIGLVSSNAFLIGASGAVMGILYGLTVLRPNYEFFLYGFLRIKVWWITVAYAFMDLLGILTDSNAGGRICHIAGGLAGALLVMFWTGKLTNMLPRKSTKSIKAYKVSINRSPNRPSQTREHKPTPDGVPSQQEIDAILDKINDSGYDNLTSKEKETLFRARDIEV